MLTTGSAALTSTLSLVLPTGSLRSSRIVSPDSTTSPFSSTVIKPAPVTVTVYLPGSTALKLSIAVRLGGARNSYRFGGQGDHSRTDDRALPIGHDAAQGSVVGLRSSAACGGERKKTSGVTRDLF